MLVSGRLNRKCPPCFSGRFLAGAGTLLKYTIKVLDLQVTDLAVLNLVYPINLL